MIERPEGIVWVRLHSSKIHAVRIDRNIWGGETLCGREVSIDAAVDIQVINNESLCARCEQSLQVGGYLRPFKDRRLSIPGVSLLSVVVALKEKDIPPTISNIEAAATHVESIASAWAKATLQDTSREDWLGWIENFKVKS